MAQSEAHMRATAKYEKKTYDKILLRLRKDREPRKDSIAVAAEKRGLKVHGYIVEAIAEKLERDGISV